MAGNPYEAVFNQLLDAISTTLSTTLTPLSGASSDSSSGSPSGSPSDAYAFTAFLAGENSQFTRFNSAKVRQSGQVRDGQLTLTLMSPERSTTASVPFIGHFETDWPLTQHALAQLHADLPHLPVDPYVVLPVAAESNASADNPTQYPAPASSREVRCGKILSAESVAQTIIGPVATLNFSGLYAGGLCYRAYGDSAGNRHWFETPSFTLDYSLFGDRPDQAVKGTLAGNHWNLDEYQKGIAAACEPLKLLAKTR